MPRIHEMVESKFLKKEEAGEGILVTVQGVEKRDVGTEDKPEEKWCLVLAECKPMVLNSTNLSLLEKALGSDDSDAWTGKKIVLYNDENVSFGGKLTGGVRVSVDRTKRYYAKQKAAPQAAPQAAAPAVPNGKPSAFDDFEDDIPF